MKVSSITIKDLIDDKKDSLPKLNKLFYTPDKEEGAKIKNVLIKRLIEVNQNRTSKVNNLAELLDCEVKDMHVHKHTCDAIVIDKQSNREVRVIIPRNNILAFSKAYPMEDIRIPVVIKYICSKEDFTLRYSSILYIRFYQYLSWLKSSWNGYCNKRGV